MTKLSASAEHLYTSFILRDILAKVIPGLILSVALLMGAFDLGLAQAIEAISRQGKPVIILLFCASWTAGFIVQEDRDMGGIAGFRVRERGRHPQHGELARAGNG